MTAMKKRPSARTGLIIVCALWATFIWAWRPSIITLTLDDTFYYIKTAANAAGGLGITFDGINATNGFHPLWMLLLIPTAMTGLDMDTLARLVLTIQILLVLGGVLLVARIQSPREGMSFSAVVAVLLTNFYYAKVLINGQESALQWFMLCTCLCWWWAIEDRGGPARLRWLGLGLLGGLTILSRLDTGFFVLGLTAMPVFWSRDPGTAWSERWWRAFSIGVGSAALLLPYLLFNLAATGHLLPVSGATRATGWCEIGMFLSIDHVAAVTLITGIYALFVASWKGRYPELRSLTPVVFYVCALTAYSKIARGAYLPEIWYLVPHMLLVAWAIYIIARRRMSRYLIAGLL